MKAEKEISIWAKALFSILENKTKDEKEKIIEKIIKILKKRKKEYFLPGIIKGLEKLYLKKKGVTLFFAREHQKGLVEKIKGKLLEVLGKDKIIDIKTEQDLIGGFRAKTENVLIKASIKDFLDELEKYYGEY